MNDSVTHHAVVANRLRQGLLALAAAGVIGTAAELAAIRHWDSTEQMIPWAALTVMAVAIAAVAVRPSRSRVLLSRGLSVATLAAGAYGVLDHVLSNLDSGPLDRTYGARWDSMSTVSQWWAAINGGVGPAPTLAPAILAQIGLCLLLATLHHPALRATEPAERRARTDLRQLVTVD